LVQRHAADAERIVAALAGAGAVSVDGNAEAVDAKVGHGSRSPSHLALPGRTTSA
jgi:hypothetical protein